MNLILISISVITTFELNNSLSVEMYRICSYETLSVKFNTNLTAFGSTMNEC